MCRGSEGNDVLLPWMCINVARHVPWNPFECQPGRRGYVRMIPEHGEFIIYFDIVLPSFEWLQH